MRKTLFTLFASTAFVTGAIAQAVPDVPHDGKWSATIRTDSGARQTSRLVISGFGGTWYGSTAPGACKHAKFPVTLQDSTAETLAFTVWGKTASPACPDLTIEMKAVDENKFEGEVVSVGKITLTKH